MAQEGIGRRDLEQKIMDTITDTTDLALEGRRTQPGVFAIENILNGRRYVCGCQNLSKRLWDAWASVRNRSHHNPALHADLGSYGPENFTLVILELVDDVRTLPALKRRHVEHARQTDGGTYNAEPPPARQKLTIDRQAAEVVAERLSAERSLNDAIVFSYSSHSPPTMELRQVTGSSTMP